MNVILDKARLDALANVISRKSGDAAPMTLADMIEAVRGISSPSGSQTFKENGTYDVRSLAEAVIDVAGGGSSGTQIDETTTTLSTAAASIQFSGLKGEPVSFAVISAADISSGSAALVYDGTSLHGQKLTSSGYSTSVTYDGSGYSKTYSNGTLTITGTGTTFQADDYILVYAYGGTAASIETIDVQVGSGATSITFTGLSDEPLAWFCIFKSDFTSSSGYQRVIAVFNDGSVLTGLEMDSAAHYAQHWTGIYNNGSLTIASQSTNAGGYFHQPGYYELVAIYGEASPYQKKTITPTTSQQVVTADQGYDALSQVTVEPIPSEYIVPSGSQTLSANGTYNVSSLAQVVVNVPSGGSAQIGTATMSNSNNQATSISFTNLQGTPKAFFVRCTTSMSRSSSSRYYYVADMRYNGTNTQGNCFYMYNGQYANVTSGYSFTYSNGTLTLSSSGSRSGSPGSFYNGTYELIYIY